MHKRNYLAFDIEIARQIPEGAQDWKSFRPFGISCAATLTHEGQLISWHGKTQTGDLADQMNQAETAELVHYLSQAIKTNYTILTWNGLGFDFDVLAEESGLEDNCKDLALDHIDMMFHLFCIKGFALGLDKAAKGMGLPGKPPGMTGELAPIYWAEGRRDEVLDYVAQDVRTTLDLAHVVEQRHKLRWISKRGKPQSLFLPDGWLNVDEALELPEPDTSWMSNPWPRSKFSGWLQQESSKDRS